MISKWKPTFQSWIQFVNLLQKKRKKQSNRMFPEFPLSIIFLLHNNGNHEKDWRIVIWVNRFWIHFLFFLFIVCAIKMNNSSLLWQNFIRVRRNLNYFLFEEIQLKQLKRKLYFTLSLSLYLLLYIKLFNCIKVCVAFVWPLIWLLSLCNLLGHHKTIRK